MCLNYARPVSNKVVRCPVLTFVQIVLIDVTKLNKRSSHSYTPQSAIHSSPNRSRSTFVRSSSSSRRSSSSIQPIGERSLEIYSQTKERLLIGTRTIVRGIADVARPPTPAPTVSLSRALSLCLSNYPTITATFPETFRNFPLELRGDPSLAPP
jgi:hypothetical protein